MDEKKKVYETDVLVLGSSASGCGAAIAARRAGAEVLLVDKGKLESSGCLGGGNDHFMAVLDETEHDSLEDMYGYYATPTSGLSRGVVKNYYRAMRPCLEVLEESGIELMRNPDGTYMRSVGFGQPGPWWIHINHGFNVKPRLAKYVRSQGVKVVNHVLVTNLLKDGDRIAGCIGFDVLKGDLIVVRCKTAVLGFGLTAQRVSNNSTHKPFNQWFSPYVTGSQVILPLEAGAGVLNVDITDMATMLPKGYGCPGMNGINSSGAHEINALGERFMGKYDPMWENGVRNNQIQGTFQEQLEGSGPPFYMDMRHVDPEVVHELQYILMPGDKATFGDWADCTGTDFQHKLLEVEIGELIFGGTIAVNDEFETSVPGLFCGSIFLYCSGAMCGGYEAGRRAALKASGIPEAGRVDEDLAARVKDDVFAPLRAERDDESVSYQELEEAARNVMMYYMGFRRSVAGMERALEKIRFLSGQIPRLRAETLRDLMRCHESREVLKVCELAIEATMERRETGRCVYKVADYPALNPDMAKPLLLLKGEKGTVFQWGKAPLL